MKTSVVIPVCNRKKELTRAIKSVRSQKNEVDEIIIVENNSKNPYAVKEVCSSFSDPRIKFYSLTECDNANVARNYGAKKAEGEVVFFLDSDDVWDVDHTFNVLNAMNSQDVEFIYGGARIFDGSHYKIRRSRLMKINECPVDFILGFGGGYAQTSSYGIRKDAFMTVLWDESLKRHQDYDFFIRASNKLSVGFNNRVDYTIFWDKSEVRSFCLPSTKRFCESFGGQMSFSTRLRYFLMMTKISLKIKNVDAILFLFLYFIKNR